MVYLDNCPEVANNIGGSEAKDERGGCVFRLFLVRVREEGHPEVENEPREDHRGKSGISSVSAETVAFETRTDISQK